jgi:hypothetical protein
MRVLLCDNKTGLYYQSPDQWTGDAASAKDFRSSFKALLFAHERSLREVEVLLDFGDPEYNVHLPAAALLSYPSGELHEEQNAA